MLKVVIKKHYLLACHLLHRRFQSLICRCHGRKKERKSKSKRRRKADPAGE